MSAPQTRLKRGTVVGLTLLIVLASQLGAACSTTSVPTSSANALSDRDAIAELKARYFRFIDTKDWARFHGLFTVDAHIDTSVDGGPIFDNTDLFVGFLINTLNDVVTVHQGHMQELQLTSPTTATGVWELEDLLRFPTDPATNAHGYGNYREIYSKVDGQWLIASLQLTRYRMDIGPNVG
jgi:hypothetical protein